MDLIQTIRREYGLDLDFAQEPQLSVAVNRLGNELARACEAYVPLSYAAFIPTNQQAIG